MPDEISTIQRRLDMNERNMSDFGKSLTEIVKDVHELRAPLEDLKTDKAVRSERDKNLHERLERMEKKIEEGFATVKQDVDERIGRLTWPIRVAATALITTIVAAVVYALKGGING